MLWQRASLSVLPRIWVYKGMAIAPGWTGAPQIHVGQAAHVEEKIEKAVACRTKRAVAEELVASLQKAKRKK